MIRLQPDWIGELVSICAADDWADAKSPLDYPSVSPMFRRLLPEVAEGDNVTGYASAEVCACKQAIEMLSKDHPQEFDALAWEFQPWRRRHLTVHKDHAALVLSAGKRLADYVDRLCGS
jgi:hypothetical protein